MRDPGKDPAAAADTVLRAALNDLAAGAGAADGLVVDEAGPRSYVVTLPGEHRLRTTCSLVVGEHALVVSAFVARRPDDDEAAVHRWLLRRNTRTYGVAFATDHHGDIYLTGRLPLPAVTAEEVDRLLGAVLDLADSSFDTILELGFADSIRREWAWRRRRGESTANLAAFRHLVGDDRPPRV